MNKAIRTTLALAAVALGSSWAVQSASAHTDVYLSVGVPAPVYAQAQPFYPPRHIVPGPPPVYVPPANGYASAWEQQRAQDAQWRQQQWMQQQQFQEELREREWRERMWRERRWREEHRRDDWRRHRHGDRDDD